MLMNEKTHYQYRRVDATCNREDVFNGFFTEEKDRNHRYEEKTSPKGFSAKNKKET